VSPAPSVPAGRDAGSIRAILFDKDGTLFDFRKTWLAAYRGAVAELAEAAGLGPAFVDILLARHGYDPASDTFTAESPLLWATTRDQAVLGSAEPELAGVADVERRLERHFSDLDAYPPVPVTHLAPLFARLRSRGFKLGGATMDSTAAAAATLARFAADGLVDFLTGYDGGHGIKPAPGMVLGFCAAARLEPDQAARQVGEEFQHLGARQLLAQHHLAAPIDAMHLEQALGDVQPDRGNLHLGRLPRSWLFLTPPWHTDAVSGRRPSHYATVGIRARVSRGGMDSIARVVCTIPASDARGLTACVDAMGHGPLVRLTRDPQRDRETDTPARSRSGPGT
jgi:phosphoglycolate phosphatase